MSSRTTKRVQCPGCGQLLRPSQALLLGRGALGCECGFSTERPAPPPLDVQPPPRRNSSLVLLGAGLGTVVAVVVIALLFWGGVLRVAEGSSDGSLATVAALIAGGLCCAAGVHRLWRRRRWFASAALMEDPATRQVLLEQVADIQRTAERGALKQADLHLRDRGLHAPEFRRAVLGDGAGGDGDDADAAEPADAS